MRIGQARLLQPVDVMRVGLSASFFGADKWTKLAQAMLYELRMVGAGSAMEKRWYQPVERADLLFLAIDSSPVLAGNHKKGQPFGGAVQVLNMLKRAVTCTSSGVPLTDKKSTSFPCPSCGEPIGRSERCRNQAVAYICPGCGFSGP